MIGIGIDIRGGGSAQTPFRFTINTNNTSAGSSTSTQFKLPLVSSGTLNAVVNWGDGTSSTITAWNQAEVTHTYATAGSYDIRITGVLSGWRFNNTGDRLKILNIISWGIYTAVGGYSGFEGAFWGCSNMNSSATDKPLLLQGTLWNFFRGCSSFNGNIGNWNMSQVDGIKNFFSGCGNFNQDISGWNVSNVTIMDNMFYNVTNFNQPIGSWNVGNVTNMTFMFNGVQLSTANYDELLIGWSTISPNETPLRPNVVFSGGNSKYCNGASARSAIISTYGWTITDGGPDANCVLDTEEFETNTLKLYPNPVVNILNIKTDHNHINQPFTIIDGLGRVVINGKFNEVDTTINVEQLSKGIYYLKVSGNSANKFIKE